MLGTCANCDRPRRVVSYKKKMWFFALPALAAWFATFAVRRALRAHEATLQHEDDELHEPVVALSDDPVTTLSEDEIGVTDSELIEAGVPVISDLLSWLEDASERLAIEQKPAVMKVDTITGRSTFLKFTSNGTEMTLWVGGPPFMGPFPRICRNTTASRDQPGITIDRNAVSLEKAVIELQKSAHMSL